MNEQNQKIKTHNDEYTIEKSVIMDDFFFNVSPI